MRKLFASIMIICYLAFSCGIIINYHYCMGRLDSVKLFVAESNICAKCGMHTAKAHGCCGDEIKIIKIQDDQNVTTVYHSIKNIEAVAKTPSVFICASFCQDEGSLHYMANSPPLLTGQDSYLQNCVFRI